MRRRALVVALVLAAFLPSCGDSSPTSPTVPPQPGITFVPTRFPFPPASLALQVRSSSPEEITLTLTATEVQDLYGWAADLVFDTEILGFVSFEQGEFLEADGIEVITQLVEGPDGRLIIGQTRVGDVDGVTGSGDVLELTLRAEAEGSTRILPQNGASFDSEGNGLGLEILGGSITVVQ